jgi:hypothetical protein
VFDDWNVHAEHTIITIGARILLWRH